MTILIIYGGASVEHEVSCLSFRNIRTILTSLGYGVRELFITKTGRFTSEGRNVTIIPGEGFIADGIPLSFDVILPLVHGNTGEDGKLQGLLEFMGYPYISEGVLTSAIGMDKLRQTEILREHVPCLRTEEYISPDMWIGVPCVMKPCSGGSSVGVHIIASGDAITLENAASDIRRYDPVPLIQTLVKDARELEMLAIRDTKRSETIILGPVEIRKEKAFLSYEDKYASALTRVIPAGEVEITDEERNSLREYAGEVFKRLGGEVYMRIDFLMDGDGRIFFNEVNTVPGMTETSHFITLSDEIGMDRVFSLLTEAAFARKRENDLLMRSYG